MKPTILMAACFAMEKPDAELIHFSSIANGLARQGYAVSIFHLSLAGAPAIRSLLRPEIRFSEHSISARKRSLMFIKGGLTVPSFLHYLVKNQPDILYVRLGIVSALYVIATRIMWRNQVKIITEHNGWIGPEALDSGKPRILASIGKELQKWSACCSHKVRAVSDGIKSYLVSLGIPEGKIAVIGNGTDTDHFHPQDIPACYDIGFTGNLAHWQGLDWLMKACALLKKKLPEVRVAIAGSGPEEQNLRDLITSTGLEHNARMLGPVGYEEIPQVINQCRICMAPFRPRGSQHDNKSLSPLKIRDYAACGKPIIASRIAGLEEIETGQFGLLVTPGDVQGLADAMAQLLQDHALQQSMAINARTYAECHYAWGAITKQIARQIEKLLSY